LANGCHLQGVVGAIEATQAVSVLWAYTVFDLSGQVVRMELVASSSFLQITAFISYINVLLKVLYELSKRLDWERLLCHGQLE
jgi:hypothetical protein